MPVSSKNESLGSQCVRRKLERRSERVHNKWDVDFEDEVPSRVTWFDVDKGWFSSVGRRLV